LAFTVKIHKVPDTKNRFRIVGFEVEPFSIAEGADRMEIDLLFDPNSDLKNRKQKVEAGKDITFSYSVTTIMDEGTTWLHRMDHYAQINSGYSTVYHAQILWAFFCLFMISLVFAQVLVHTVSKDFKAIR
jgi:hypothetical protein